MKFTKGQSGNPQGRPRDTRTASLRALLTPHAPDLVAKAVELAREGDTTALRLCLERILPALRPRDEPVTLEALKGEASLLEQARTVVDALAVGSLSPGEASTIMQALAGEARIVETAELERRIAALEEKCPPTP